MSGKSGPRGWYGIGIYRPKTPVNLGSLWRSADLMGAKYIFTVGHRYHPRGRDASDTTKAWRNIPLYNYEDLEAFVDTFPENASLVGVEGPREPWPRNWASLPDFEHPEQAVYLLGAEDSGLPPEVRVCCERLVEIPTVKPYSLNVACAGSIVMYDRWAKGVA